MVEVTTTRRSPEKPKAFSWSYSKIKNYESCPKKHWHVDIAKDIKEPESDELKWGNQLHDAMAKRIGKGMVLPEPMKHLEHWAQKIAPLVGLPPGVIILVEQKLAIRADFTPCKFFDKDAWFRAIGDVIKIVGPVALILDWKTGKIKEDSVQLALAAQCVFSHYPEVKKVRSLYVWLKEDAETKADFTRDDMPGLWRGLWPRIEQLKHAHETMTYPAKPGGLCRRWCPVTVCPHHGE